MILILTTTFQIQLILEYMILSTSMVQEIVTVLFLKELITIQTSSPIKTLYIHTDTVQMRTFY